MPRSPRLIAVLALAAALLGGCAGTARTTLETSWHDPAAATFKPVRKVLIMTVAEDERAQQIYQTEMAAQLKAHGVNAVPSRAYFTRYNDAERNRFKRVIESSDADAILLTRVVGVDTKTNTSPGMMIGMNGAPYAQAYDLYGAYARAFDPTHYVAPSDYSRKTVRAEASLYMRKTQKLIWSARTRIDDADEGDLTPAVKQFVAVLITAADKDGMLPVR